MRYEVQVEMLANVLASPELLSMCSGAMRSNFFDPELRKAVDFILLYHEEYSAPPPVELVNAEFQTGFPIRENITADVIEYSANKIATHCRHRALERFAMSVVSQTDAATRDENFDIEEALQEALMVGLTPEVAKNHYDDVYDRLLDREDISGFSTGYPELDELIGAPQGSFARQTVTLFMGNSGSGKSVILLNVARNLAQQQLDVLFITLELSKKMTEERLDMIITKKKKMEIYDSPEEYAPIIEREGKRDGFGTLIIEKFPMSGTTVNHIKKYIMEYHTVYGKYPDVIAIDYLDVMTPNQGDTSDVFKDDKRISEQVKAMGEEFDAIIVTASQQNRDGIDVVDTSQRHIAGGISKINTVDNAISIIRNDQLIAQNKVFLKAVKVRSGTGTGETISLNWNSGELLISNDPDTINTSHLKEGSGRVEKGWPTTDGNQSRQELLDSLSEFIDM